MISTVNLAFDDRFYRIRRQSFIWEQNLQDHFSVFSLDIDVIMQSVLEDTHDVWSLSLTTPVDFVMTQGKRSLIYWTAVAERVQLDLNMGYQRKLWWQNHPPLC